MKVRIGYGLGTQASSDGERFVDLVDGVEQLQFDSLWLSERITGECPDPIVGLAVAAGRTTRLKLGFSVLVLPGRNPMLLAKELATLDRLSSGRLLPAFGLGVVDPGEQQAFGIERSERGARFDELLPLLRRFWTGEPLDHDGSVTYRGARVRPTPAQAELEVWLGGIAPSEVRRCARLGDGWLPSFCTPADVERGIEVIEAEAALAGRHIDPEHYGALIAYATGPLPDRVGEVLRRRRPDLDPGDVIAAGLDDLASRIEAFIQVGASKFVVVPLAEPSSWEAHLRDVAQTLLPLQGDSSRSDVA
jgi:probable F420-dependent oxidoreductase